MTPKIWVSFHFLAYWCLCMCRSAHRNAWWPFKRGVKNRGFYGGVSARTPWNYRIFSRRRRFSAPNLSADALLGLRQVSAPAAWASPGCDASVLPAFPTALRTGNTEASYCAPSPSGDWWRKRGATNKRGGVFPHFSRRYGNRVGLFLKS